jgi:hypothetical protein
VHAIQVEADVSPLFAAGHLPSRTGRRAPGFWGLGGESVNDERDPCSRSEAEAGDREKREEATSHGPPNSGCTSNFADRSHIDS